MKLPRRGMLIDARGCVCWSWEHNDPTTEFDMPPPHVERLDGTIGPPSPDMIVLDCDEEFGPGDMDMIHATRADVRMKKVNGQWEFSQLFEVEDDLGEKVIVEIPHPIEARRAARKKAKEPK